ncbi:uncharacterized protein LOC130973440 [Arachis stenosperma]|uniref:uncharacterized protein LOC130973440 n=1 Tax=Arachis stenosperma TaxID=217475 RepID=UPI0025ABFDD1|nr:uncharacterized protein LOC130973440 [Arachis stenosperma]
MAASATNDHNQWKQFYNQHQTHQMTAAVAATTTMVAASSSSESILSPKGSGVTKPIRRRSRASKKTPTTLLNANTTNFRALVQQFTGCPNSNNSIMSCSSLIGVHNKGPITLNFQQGSSSSAARRTIIPSSFVVGGGSGRDYCYDDHNQGQQQLAATTTTNNNSLFPWQKQQDHQLQEQESGYSFDEYVMKNSYNSDDHGMMMIMDNDFSLHDLAVNNNAFPDHDTY